MKSELIQLVKSLSASEKRAFKLYCKKQSGEKLYAELYEIINSNSLKSLNAIEVEFQHKFPNRSLETTAQYLQKIIINILVQNHIEHDPRFRILHGIMC